MCLRARRRSFAPRTSFFGRTIFPRSAAPSPKRSPRCSASPSRPSRWPDPTARWRSCRPPASRPRRSIDSTSSSPKTAGCSRRLSPARSCGRTTMRRRTFASASQRGAAPPGSASRSERAPVSRASSASFSPKTAGSTPAFRDAIRSLAAQAGLAHELIAARDDLRRAASDAEAQRRTATAFFEVATRLSTVTDVSCGPG